MRNVVVTGGSRGLGLAIARKLAAGGYSVIALARKKTDQVSAAIQEATRQKRGALHFVSFDLGEVEKIPDLVKSLRKEFGPIYALVNNAALGTEGVLATMHNAKIEQLVRLNTVSPIVLTKYVVRSMMSEGGGRIVNVYAIAPGFMDTEMTQGMGDEDRQKVARRSALRRLPDVDDVAHAVEFLLGDGAKNITGTVMTVDAGSTA